MTFKFNGWPRKTTGYLFYAMSSFVIYFKATSEFKLELQSGNAESGSNRQNFAPCEHEIWLITLKNNRAPLLCYFKLCVSFHSHRSIQTQVTVRKCPIQVKIKDSFLYATSSFVYHFIAICEFILELQYRNAQFRSNYAIFCHVWPWNLTDNLEKQ